MSLKKNLIEILRSNPIEFTLDYHHKGHFVNITGADEIQSELEDWIAYEVLVEYLVGESIFYNFTGSFGIESEKLMIYLWFTGPLADEEEVDFDLILDYETLKDEYGINLHDITNIQNEEIETFFGFSYDNINEFERFDFYCKSNEDEIVKLTEHLTEDQLMDLKKHVASNLICNIPDLNHVPSSLEQNWYVECDGDCINYSITGGPLELNWDDVTLE